MAASTTATEDRVRMVVDAAHDAFVETTRDGTITEWNRAAEAHLGWSRDEALGQNLRDSILRGESAERFGRARDALDAEASSPSRQHRIEVQALRKDGHEVSVEMTIWPSWVDGELRVNLFAHDLTERLRFQEELRQLAVAATTDPGTGVKNRRGFFALAEHEMSVAQRLGQTLTLIFFDLDHLKAINDTRGHLEGDRAIADAAALLSSTFRESDLVARLGGDEFCVLALGSESALDRTIRRFEEAVDHHNDTAGRGYRLALSHGVAFYDPADRTLTLDDLISGADASMYAAKLARNRSA